MCSVNAITRDTPQSPVPLHTGVLPPSLVKVRQQQLNVKRFVLPRADCFFSSLKEELYVHNFSKGVPWNIKIKSKISAFPLLMVWHGLSCAYPVSTLGFHGQEF